MTASSAKTWREGLGWVEKKRTFDTTLSWRLLTIYASQYSNRAAAQMHGIDEKRAAIPDSEKLLILLIEW